MNYLIIYDYLFFILGYVIIINDFTVQENYTNISEIRHSVLKAEGNKYQQLEGYKETSQLTSTKFIIKLRG